MQADVFSATASRRAGGFTLIELMIVVAIIAILLIIAVPAYDAYIKKSHIRVAEQNLNALSLALENVYQRELVYPTLSSTSTSQTEADIDTWVAAEPTEFSYAVTSTDTSYTITASGLAANLSGCTLSLGKDNTQSISGCGDVTSW